MKHHPGLIRTAAAWLLFVCAPVALAHPDPTGTPEGLHAVLHGLLGSHHLPGGVVLALAGAALLAAIALPGRWARLTRYAALGLAGAGVWLLAA